MAFNDYKVTEKEVQENGVQGVRGNTLSGSVPDNKKVFDRLCTFLINKYNSMVDWLSEKEASLDAATDAVNAATAATEAANTATERANQAADNVYTKDEVYNKDELLPRKVIYEKGVTTDGSAVGGEIRKYGTLEITTPHGRSVVSRFGSFEPYSNVFIQGYESNPTSMLIHFINFGPYTDGPFNGGNLSRRSYIHNANGTISMYKDESYEIEKIIGLC